VEEKGGGGEGRWRRREVEKGGGGEGRWRRREVEEKGGGVRTTIVGDFKKIKIKKKQSEVIGLFYSTQVCLVWR